MKVSNKTRWREKILKANKSQRKRKKYKEKVQRKEKYFSHPTRFGLFFFPIIHGFNYESNIRIGRLLFRLPVEDGNSTSLSSEQSGVFS